jgi:hypothetical protein
MVNPLFEKIVGALLRWLLTFLGAQAVGLGIWNMEDNTAYVAGVAAALVALAWSLWEKYRTRIQVVTALAMPAGTPQKVMETQVSSGDTPPATLDKARAPYLPNQR